MRVLSVRVLNVRVRVRMLVRVCMRRSRVGVHRARRPSTRRNDSRTETRTEINKTGDQGRYGEGNCVRELETRRLTAKVTSPVGPSTHPHGRPLRRRLIFEFFIFLVYCLDEVLAQFLSGFRGILVARLYVEMHRLVCTWLSDHLRVHMRTHPRVYASATQMRKHTHKVYLGTTLHIILADNVAYHPRNVACHPDNFDYHPCTSSEQTTLHITLADNYAHHPSRQLCTSSEQTTMHIILADNYAHHPCRQLCTSSLHIILCISS